MIDNSTWWICIGVLIVLFLLVSWVRAERERNRKPEDKEDELIRLLRSAKKTHPGSTGPAGTSSPLTGGTGPGGQPGLSVNKSNLDSRAWAPSGNARRDRPDDGGISIHSPLHPHSPFSSANHESVSDHAHSYGCSSSSDSSSSPSSSSSCD